MAKSSFGQVVHPKSVAHQLLLFSKCWDFNISTVAWEILFLQPQENKWDENHNHGTVHPSINVRLWSKIFLTFIVS